MTQGRYRMVAGELQWWRPWLADEKAQLARLVSEGVSQPEIARRLKRRVGAVRHACQRFGLSPAGARAPAWPPERLAEARRLRAQGLTFGQVARKMGNTTRSAVLGQLHRHGA